MIQTDNNINPIYMNAFIRYLLLKNIPEISDKINYYRFLSENLLSDYSFDLGINEDNVVINTIEDKQSWRFFTSMTNNDDNLIYQSIEPFKQYSEVSEIYYCNEENIVEFFVLLDKEEYDFDFMHELFKIERIIKRMWDGKHAKFNYLPTKGMEKSILIGYHIGFMRG